jgi:Glycosyltransferase family 87
VSSPCDVSPSISRAGWSVPYYVKGLALGIPPYLVAVHLWTWLLIVPSGLRTTGYDFRQVYAAAYLVRSGHAHELYLYNSQKQVQDELVSMQPEALPFVSPAYEALLFSPLAMFKFRTAYLIFLGVNLISLGVCFALLRPWMSHLQVVFRWLPAAIFLGFLPIAAALIEGQDSILLLTFLTIAFVLAARQSDFSAGLVTGLAFFKFPIVLPIALLLFIWRRWRFVAGFAVSTVAVVSVSVWITGISQTRLYVESLISIAGLKPANNGLEMYPVNWRMMANLHGLTAGVTAGSVSNSWLSGLTILLSAIVLVWTAIRGLQVNGTSGLLLLAIPCSLLVAHHTYMHDLSVLLLPTIVILDDFLPAEATGMKRERLIARAAALTFVAPVVESFAPSHFYVVAIPVMLLLAATASAASMRQFPASVRLLS